MAVIGVPMASAQPPLPKGWNSTEIGSPTPSGSSSEKKGIYTISGGGADIWSTSDQFTFANTLFVGNGTIVARVDSVQGPESDMKVGIMLRESLAANSANGLAMIDGAGNYQYQWRQSSGATTQYTYGAGGSAPIWLKLERTGTQIIASRSADGATWTVIGKQAISMATTIYAGLAVTSHSSSALATAKFSNVTIADSASSTPPPPSPPPGLPTGWTSTDVGTPTPSGNASAANGVFAVQGGGADIWDASDQFTFVNQSLTGDGTIVARITGLDAPDANTKAGVMMRESLSSNAKNAMALIDGSGNYQYQWRAAAGGTTAYTYGPGAATPIWLKLQRTGTQIQASRSSNGSSWTVIGTQIIAMQSTIYVGLAVTSHNPAALASASFASVAVTSGGASPPTNNQPPTVTLTSSGGATAPATLTLSATASDPDGSIASVAFYSGSTQLGTATASPYTYIWSNVAAGTYSLTAVATDNAGASTTSATQTVTVGAGGGGGGGVNQPPVITLSSPANGATFSAPAAITFTAAASDADGTVTRVDFYGGPNIVGSVTSAPYTTTWTNVPAGTYTVYAIARDNSGNVTSTAQRTVTVQSKMPTTAIFTPSSNEATAVNYYMIEFFPSATTPKAGAGVASQNLGKPATINGQAQANISTTVQGLQAGTYVAIVTAYGPNGSASSQPSLPFVR